MCPFFVLTFIFSFLLLAAEISAAVISVKFNPATVSKLYEGEIRTVNFTIRAADDQSPFSPSLSDELVGTYHFVVDRPDVADVLSTSATERRQFTIWRDDLTQNGTRYDSSLQIRANFLGYSRIEIHRTEKSRPIATRIIGGSSSFGPNSISLSSSSSSSDDANETSNDSRLIVSVIRDKDILQKIFIYSVAIVVSISYINMGCALDTHEVYQVLRRPVAPAIGLFSQYLCMPLLSYGIGKLLLDETYLRLGLFIFGCSPGGGASNMWAVLLGGNLNLSITMTFLSTLLSFGMLPFWLYTLGRTIFVNTATAAPSRSIITSLGSMLVFLGIGLLVKRYLPKLSNIYRRILAPFSVAMIVFIIFFGTYTNLYMFKVMNARILLATAANVWTGMAIGFALALFFRKPIEDVITIAIETGVQNTGVGIVLLGISLQQPDADLASAVPVAASIMTPIPLTVAYFAIKIRDYYRRKRHMSIGESNEFEKDNGGERLKNSSSIESNVITVGVNHYGGGGTLDSASSARTSDSNLIKAI